MYKKIVIENARELLNVASKARCEGDDTPSTNGKLSIVLLGLPRCKLVGDDNVEFEGDAKEVIAVFFKQCGLEVQFT